MTITKLADIPKHDSRLDFYRRHYADLFEPMRGLMRHGVQVDKAAMTKMRNGLGQNCAEWNGQLEAIVGHPLAGKIAMSPLKVANYVYKELEFPPIRNKGKVTTDEVALRKCISRAQGVITKEIPKGDEPWSRRPRRTIEALKLIIRHRGAQKKMGQLKASNLDEDGRLRCRYVFGPDTGRFASKKSAYKRGMNLQNPSREIRRIFVPDPGCVFLELDYSQAESRDVYIQTGDPYLRKLARAQPYEHDDHARTAALIFLPEFTSREFIVKGSLPIDKEQRQFGKKTRHALHYGEGGIRMSDDLLNESDGLIVRTGKECQIWLDQVKAKDPAIGEWQSSIRSMLMRDMYLENSWGRILDLTFERLEEATFRRAYAFGPQSDIGDNLNLLGLVPLYRFIKKNRMRTRINLQVHDALIMSCPPDEMYDIAAFTSEQMQVTRNYFSPVKQRTYKMSIPVEFYVGPSWSKKTGVEFDRLPDRGQVKEACKLALKWDDNDLKKAA